MNRCSKVESALVKIEAAQYLIAEAAEELSSLEGFAREWEKLVRLHGAVRKLWEEVERRGNEL